MDDYTRTRELDKTKSRVFLDDKGSAAFLGSIMCSLKFIWDEQTETASTNGVYLKWNPKWFEKLHSDARHFVMMHELDHVARLHMLRRGNRHARAWNYACDVRINNSLVKSGYKHTGIDPAEMWFDPSVDANGIMAEEDIYDLIMKNVIKIPPQYGSWGDADGQGDMTSDITPAVQQTVLSTIARAVQQAKLAKAGNLPGGVEDWLNQFLAPVVNWEVELMEFFTDLQDISYTWKRPNRRYPDIYLPSRFLDDGRLASLNYYVDVSGSITNDQIIRMNSEVKYIQEEVKPQKLTLIQFNTQIVSQQVFESDQPYTNVKIHKGGGTRLQPVREHIEETKPTAAIIFGDLEVDPMEPLTVPIPIIWAVVDNKSASVPFGKLIHLD